MHIYLEIDYSWSIKSCWQNYWSWGGQRWANHRIVHSRSARDSWYTWRESLWMQSLRGDCCASGSWRGKINKKVCNIIDSQYYSR